MRRLVVPTILGIAVLSLVFLLGAREASGPVEAHQGGGNIALLDIDMDPTGVAPGTQPAGDGILNEVNPPIVFMVSDTPLDLCLAGEPNMGANPCSGPDGTFDTENVINGQAESCISVTHPATFDVDIVVQGYPDPGGWQDSLVLFDITLGGVDPGLLLNATGIVDGSVNMPGFRTLLSADPQSGGAVKGSPGGWVWPVAMNTGLNIPMADLGGPTDNVNENIDGEENSDGHLTRVTLTTTGAGPAVIPLHLSSSIGFVADANAPVPIDNIGGVGPNPGTETSPGSGLWLAGTVAIGQPCPLPADLSVTQVDDAPDTGNISVNEDFTVTKTIHNDGPATPVNAEVAAAGDAPEDCELSYHATNSEVADIPAGVAYTLNGAPGTGPANLALSPSDDVVVTGAAGGPEIVVRYPVNGLATSIDQVVVEEWDKHCYEPSDHQFTITNTVTRTDAGAPPDSDPTNNSDTSVIDEEIWATTDVAIASVAIAGVDYDNDGTNDVVGKPSLNLPGYITSDDGYDNDGDWDNPADDVGCDGVAATADWGEGNGKPTSEHDCILYGGGSPGDGEPDIDEDPINGVDDDGDTAVDEDGGDVWTIQIDKTLANLGPYGGTITVGIANSFYNPAGVELPGGAGSCMDMVDNDGNTVADALDPQCNVATGIAPDPYIGNIANCTLTPDAGNPVSAVLPPGATVVTEYWDLHCGLSPFANHNDDLVNDIEFDEDPIDGTNQDPGNDGTADEDPSFEIVAMAFAEAIAPVTPHIIDPDLTNNANYTSDGFAAFQPSNPSMVAFQDESSNPSDPGYSIGLGLGTPPDPSKDCLLASPCEQQMQVTQPGGNPLHGAMITIPNPDGIPGGLGYDITSSLAVTNGPGPTPGGTLVGSVYFSVMQDLGAGCTAPASGYFLLYDGALPGPGSILWNAATSEGPNVPGQAALLDPSVWPLNLDSDPQLLGVSTGGGAFPPGTVPVYARYVGFHAASGNLVNVIVFNTGGGPTGGFVHVPVIGDPVNPSGATNCTPYISDVDYLGETTDFGSGLTVRLRECAEIATHVIGVLYTRSDNGMQSTGYDLLTCSAENDVDITKTDDPIIGDEVDGPVTPPDPSPDRVHVSVPTTRNIELSVTNGQVPADIDISVGMVFTSPTGSSPPECEVQLDPPNGSAIIIGDRSVSDLQWREMGLAAFENRVITVPYEIHCSEAGVYAPGDPALQIIVNASAVRQGSNDPLPDPDTNNNQAQNRVKVISEDDYDDDTVPTPGDNCPDDPNPDQADNDGDGIGDVCDPDDDNDGVPDATDECPLTPEDPDGIDSADGCPDTDISISKDTPDAYEVDASETVTKTVDITVTNHGNMAADVLVHALTVTDMAGDCELHMVPEAGDSLVEFQTDEDLDTVNDTAWSQLEWTEAGMYAGEVRNLSRDYTIHCSTRSTHVDAFELQVDAVPLPPVKENSMDTDDNVEKNYPDVTVWDKADVKKVDLVLDVPDSATIGTPFQVQATSFIHNNGPVVTDVHDTTTLSVPGDCDIEGAGTSKAKGNDLTLDVSVTVPLVYNFSVTCTDPSFHLIEATNDVTATNLHVYDPDLTNNTDSDSAEVPVVANINVSVDQVVTAPATLLLGDQATITVEKTITYTGDLPSVDVDVVKTSTVPDRCYLEPPGDSYTVNVANGVPAVVVETMDFDCVIKTAADVTIDNTVSVEAAPHLEGTLTDSDSDTVSILVGMDASAVSIGVSDPNDLWGQCPVSSFTIIQSHVYPMHFCEEDDNVAGQGVTVTGPTLVEIGGLPQGPYTHENPLYQLEQVNDLEKVVEFTEPGKWHCISVQDPSRCTVNGETVPFSTLAWVFELPTGGNACVVQEPGDSKKLVDPCYLDFVKYGKKIIWTEYDHNLQRDVVAEIQWYQEDEVPPGVPPDPLWEEEMLTAVPQSVLDVLGQSYAEGPDSAGPVTLEIRLCINEPFDANPANDCVSTSVTKNIDPDRDADSIPDGQDNCPDDPNPDQQDTDQDGIGDACDPDPEHDVSLDCPVMLGPAAVNISDFNGRYGWLICQISNNEGGDALVTIHAPQSISTPPANCSQVDDLILPGQTTFVLLEGESKSIVERIRIECHAPAAPQVYDLEITKCIDHIGPIIGTGVEDDLSNNCDDVTRPVVIDQP